MSYNIPKMLNSEFQSPSIKIQDLKLTLLLILTLFVFSYEFQSNSIKIEDSILILLTILPF